MQTPEPANSSHNAASAHVGILLVEPEADLRESRRLLLLKTAVPVHVVCDYRGVFHLDEGNSYNLAIINVRHNDRQAREVSEFVRERWPWAKVLLLGEGCGCIDDPLYDEIVDATCHPSALLEASERLLKAAHAAQILSHTQSMRYSDFNG